MNERLGRIGIFVAALVVVVFWVLCGWLFGVRRGHENYVPIREYRTIERRYEDLALRKKAQDTVWKEILEQILQSSRVDQNQLAACLEELGERQ